MLAKIWKYLAIGIAVLAGTIVAYFMGGEQKRGQQAAAVDAAKSADALAAAVEQQAVARQKMTELADKEIEETNAINAQRQDLASGKTDTSDIDALLRKEGIIR